MAWDWLVRTGAWVYGIKPEELDRIEKALPAVARVGRLAKEADPLIKQSIDLYTRAQPILDEAIPLVEEFIPLLKMAAPLIDKAREEAEGLLPVYDTVIDILERHRVAGTNGIREVQYTLQSAYPAVRPDEDVIAAVRRNLSASEVRHLQQLLNIHTDGIFGGQTLRAVKDFQAKHGLVIDGFPGKVTRAVLEAVQ